jgi:hypothetical protein
MLKERSRMNPILRNIVRTAVPSAVGAVVTYLTKLGAHLTPTEAAVVFPVATTAYYSAIRVLENRYPKLSWLLGALPQPTNKVATPDVTK